MIFGIIVVKLIITALVGNCGYRLLQLRKHALYVRTLADECFSIKHVE